MTENVGDCACDSYPAEGEVGLGFAIFALMGIFNNFSSRESNQHLWSCQGETYRRSITVLAGSVLTF